MYGAERGGETERESWGHSAVSGSYVTVLVPLVNDVSSNLIGFYCKMQAHFQYKALLRDTEEKLFDRLAKGSDIPVPERHTYTDTERETGPTCASAAPLHSSLRRSVVVVTPAAAAAAASFSSSQGEMSQRPGRWQRSERRHAHTFNKWLSGVHCCDLTGEEEPGDGSTVVFTLCTDRRRVKTPGWMSDSEGSRDDLCSPLLTLPCCHSGSLQERTHRATNEPVRYVPGVVWSLSPSYCSCVSPPLSLAAPCHPWHLFSLGTADGPPGARLFHTSLSPRDWLSALLDRYFTHRLTCSPQTDLSSSDSVLLSLTCPPQIDLSSSDSVLFRPCPPQTDLSSQTLSSSDPVLPDPVLLRLCPPQTLSSSDSVLLRSCPPQTLSSSDPVLLRLCPPQIPVLPDPVLLRPCPPQTPVLPDPCPSSDSVLLRPCPPQTLSSNLI
ncbi:hypothetical protein WMY93_030120 [Mugilogobius chulae]|uniref:Uncharacterized protein n=1 Tax=Mugilogobius chulae TaxID=88201 RepID=A0AAW0MT41_9GOBI